MMYTVYTMYMADMVIRNVDDEFMRRVRAKAALEGSSLKQWVVEVLKEAVDVRIHGSVNAGRVGQHTTEAGEVLLRGQQVKAGDEVRSGEQQGEAVRGAGHDEKASKGKIGIGSAGRTEHDVKACRV